MNLRNILVILTVIFTRSTLAQNGVFHIFLRPPPQYMLSRYNQPQLQQSRSFDDELRPKIVGGEDAGRIVPYQISLQVKRRPGKRFQNADWAHNCGGSILKPTVILTAAHCVVRFKPDRLSVVVGTDNRKSGGTRYRVNKIIVHDEYKELREHDIALLHTEKIRFGPNVQPVQLQREHIGGAETCTLTGWGYTYPVRGGKLPDNLQVLRVPTISNDKCKTVMKQLTDGEICTLKGPLEAACGGDSGGPLICRGKQTGIVSYGSRICGSGAPDVFTRVSEHLDWIEDNSEGFFGF